MTEAAQVRPRPFTIALALVGAGLAIQVLNTLRMLPRIHMMLDNPRWLAVHLAVPVIIAALLPGLARRWTWARLLLLIVTLANFAELCWQMGYLYQRSPDDMSVLLIPTFLLGRLLPLVLYLVALHLLFFRADAAAARQGG